MLWSVLSPMGALMFSGPRRAWAWFVGYLLLIMVSVVFDTVFTMSDHTVPALVSAAFFVFNIAGVTSIAFFLLRYFVRKGEETISELGEKHHQVTREKARLYKIKSMMANFVPEIPKKMIEENPEKELLGKYIQDATVLFLDIEGFASLTEKYPYETINQTIEHHFSLFFDLVKKQGGDINETAGDGMMVIFLDSVTGGHAGNAVRAALDILTCCPDRSEEMKKGSILRFTAQDGSFFCEAMFSGCIDGGITSHRSKALMNASVDIYDFAGAFFPLICWISIFMTFVALSNFLIYFFPSSKKSGENFSNSNTRALYRSVPCISDATPNATALT